jgi:hypothetical protein
MSSGPGLHRDILFQKYKNRTKQKTQEVRFLFISEIFYCLWLNVGDHKELIILYTSGI